MNPEQRYRRLLRTLPRGYRAAWEEDMVGAFLDSGARRLPLGERLSILGLAVRLRLAGSYASPRTLVWHRAAQTLALMWLLFLAAMVTSNIPALIVSTMDGYGAPGWWELASGVGWVATFFCLVFCRNTAARMLAALAVVAVIGSVAARYAAADGPMVNASALVATVMFAVVPATLVFVTPHGAKPSKGFWLTAYAVAVLVSVPATGLPFTPPSAYVDPYTITALATELAAVFALFRRRRAPHRLIALAFAVGLVGLMQTAGIGSYPPALVIAAPLAATCLVVGLLQTRRLGQSAATG